jgi:hypothetical protein
MGLPQAFGDMFGLPEGEGAFTGGDAQGIGIHGFVKLCRSLNFHDDYSTEYLMSDTANQ